MDWLLQFLTSEPQSASDTIQQLEEESRDMARSLYDAAVLTTVVGWFYREGYRQQRPVDFGDNDKRICEVAEAVQVAREKLRDADARWTDLPREDLDNFMDGVVDDEDRESMTLGGVRIPIRGRQSR